LGGREQALCLCPGWFTRDPVCRTATPPPPAPPAPQSVPHLGPDGLHVGAPGGRSFGAAIAVCLKEYATFSGLFYAITSLGLGLPALASGWRRLHDTNRSGWWFGGFVVAMVVAVITFAVMAAEGGDPEAALAFGILRAVGGLVFAITLLFFYIQKGQPHPDRFG
jgi:uncharacterized membrane protein YhaH (DUF805 family)